MSLTKTGARLVRVIKYRVFLRLVSSLVIFSTFTVSLPAAPSTIVGTANRTWQEARFAILSAAITEKLPIGLAAFFKASWRKSSTTGDISQIRIFPGPLTISQGQETVLSAVAYDSNDEPLSGIPFEWSVTDVGRQRAPKRLLTSTYKPSIPGTFKISVQALGHEAEIPVTVTRFIGSQVPERPGFSISSLTGRRPIQRATKEKDGTVQETSPRGVETQAQLLPARVGRTQIGSPPTIQQIKRAIRLVVRRMAVRAAVTSS